MAESYLSFLKGPCSYLWGPNEETSRSYVLELACTASQELIVKYSGILWAGCCTVVAWNCELQGNIYTLEIREGYKSKIF